MANYTAEIDSAYEDIKDNGLSIVLRILTSATVDKVVGKPWKGKEILTTPSDQGTYGLFVGIEQYEVDGTRILVTDLGMLIPGKDLSPIPNTEMQLLAGGVTYTIAAIVKSVVPDGNLILSKVALRK